jgi:hypothetical protein
MRYMVALSAALLVPLYGSQVAAQTVVPVQFAQGVSSSTINGAIRGQVYTDYRIVIGGRQVLSVTPHPTAGSPYFNVMEPGSTGEAIYNSSIGEQRYSGTTAHNGAYTIRVYQMRASGRRGEVARFQLSVSVTSGGGGATQFPGGGATQLVGDALVPGTPYHATSVIRCRSAAGAAMGTCKAGVIRRRGSATVHLDTPDGGERTILIRNGVAVSSDGDSRIGVERRGDTGIVRIGPVEVYEIPDALIFGG